MNNAYIDIYLLPDPEFSASVLMNALFSKFHRAVVSYGAGKIGVSFPEVRQDNGRSLGTCLRLHGSAEVLHAFAQTDWLTGMHDHVSCATVATVPARAQYRAVRRVQAKSNPDRERRRLMARKGISWQEAVAAIPDSCAERLELPFVTVSSRSTGQQFRLFIEHLPVQEQPCPGIFSAYGLSSSTTIPWF